MKKAHVWTLSGLVLMVLGAGGYLLMDAQHTEEASEPESTQGAAPVHAELLTVDSTVFQGSIAGDARTVLDVRTPEEYAAGHLPGAVNIDFYAPDFRTKLEALDPHASYAVYCRSGNRSGQALEQMRAMGFTSVINLKGGIVAWEQAGRDVCTTGTC